MFVELNNFATFCQSIVIDKMVKEKKWYNFFSMNHCKMSKKMQIILGNVREDLIYGGKISYPET